VLEAVGMAQTKQLNLMQELLGEGVWPVLLVEVWNRCAKWLYSRNNLCIMKGHFISGFLMLIQRIVRIIWRPRLYFYHYSFDAAKASSKQTESKQTSVQCDVPQHGLSYSIKQKIWTALQHPALRGVHASSKFPSLKKKKAFLSQLRICAQRSIHPS